MSEAKPPDGDAETKVRSGTVVETECDRCAGAGRETFLNRTNIRDPKTGRWIEQRWWSEESCKNCRGRGRIIRTPMPRLVDPDLGALRLFKARLVLADELAKFRTGQPAPAGVSEAIDLLPALGPLLALEPHLSRPILELLEAQGFVLPAELKRGEPAT